MRTRAIAAFLCAVLAACVTVLACAGGLAGVARALGAANAHTCSCTSGGTHASCPVCNPRLHERRSAPEPVIDGLRCGDGRHGLGGAIDPGFLPAPLAGIAPTPMLRHM